LRATLKPAFIRSFTLRKKVNFAMGGAIEDVGMLDMGASYDVKATVQPRAMENQEEPWIITKKRMAGYVLLCADSLMSFIWEDRR
jgi:hypothetical protein